MLIALTICGFFPKRRRNSASPPTQVLDLWVDSFNPEFIERSMAGVIRDLMLALWGHIQPHPNPHGTKVGVHLQCSCRLRWTARLPHLPCHLSQRPAGGGNHGQTGRPLPPVAAGGPQQRVQAHPRVRVARHPGLLSSHLLPCAAGSLHPVCSSRHQAR